MKKDEDFKGFLGEAVTGNISKASGTKPTKANKANKTEKKQAGRPPKAGPAPKYSNIGFTPENYEFLKAAAASKGIPMIDYINFVVEQFRKDRPELNKAILASIKLSKEG